MLKFIFYQTISILSYLGIIGILSNEVRGTMVPWLLIQFAATIWCQRIAIKALKKIINKN